MSKKNKPSKSPCLSTIKPDICVDPSRHPAFLWPGFIITFVIQFIIYLFTLAPTVTFEDSGELVAAAYTLGVPHQPGYPLFALIGKLFSYLPAGSIAFRINLMSAFFSALAVGLLFPLIAYLIHELRSVAKFRFLSSHHEWLIPAAGIPIAIYTGLTPSYWSQAVITEVYGLNNFFTSLLILVFYFWYRTYRMGIQQKTETTRRTDRYFYLYTFLCGLALTNHHTSIVFLPLGLLFIILADRNYLLDIRRTVKGAAAFLCGLIPYGYLPLSSATNPPVDWGNPENWTNFWRVVTRHQYGLDVTKPRSFPQIASQIGVHYELFFEQFGWILVGIGLVAILVFLMYRWPVFFYSLVFAILTGPLVAYITNINLTIRDPFSVAEQRALVSVMFLPFYLGWGAISGAGFYFILQWLRHKTHTHFVTLFVLSLFGVYLGWTGIQNYHKENMRSYYYTERFYETIEKHLPANALILANWDPFAFPPMYYQYAEKRFTDMIFIDVELLRRSWYIQMLRQNHPEFMRISEKETNEFLMAVQPFENNEKFDPNFIQSKYIAMINSFIDRHYGTRPVYLMIYDPIRPLEGGIAADYRLVSRLIARQLIRSGDSIPEMDDTHLDISYLFETASRDRMSDMLRNYHAILFAEKAMQIMDQPQRAFRYFDRSLELAVSPLISRQIRIYYDQLKTILSQNQQQVNEHKK